MVERYLSGSIGQLLERARQLRQIVHGTYPREYDGLRQICLNNLDDIQAECQRLAQETVIDAKLQTPTRVRRFKRVAEQLNRVEGVGVFALSRMDADDRFLNRLFTRICGEIAYPLVVPTVSHISQDYFHIYLPYNLLCIPLIESRFLLHLPDIYHELCHLFSHAQNIDLPVLETYHAAYERSQFDTVKYFLDEIIAVDRLRKPPGFRDQLEMWWTIWIKYWMQEFFCDLFGVLIAGPAFAWSHYHLCVKRGGDPFKMPLETVATHPADDARMRAALVMLTAIGFDAEAKQIEKAWREYVEIMGYHPVAEYHQCYPQTLMTGIVSAAQEGIEGTGVVVAKPDSLVSVVGLLNGAWQEFWRAPEDYQAWEAKQLEILRATVDAAV